MKHKAREMKQLPLFDTKIKTAFGGTLNVGKRKGTRPLDSRRPVHLIFKAKSEELLLARRDLVRATIEKIGAKNGVRIQSMAVNADHIHIIIEIPNRQLYTRWIRGVTGVLTRKVPGLEWRQLPFTEIVNWGRHLSGVHSYLEENRGEGDFILETHSLVNRWIRSSQVTVHFASEMNTLTDTSYRRKCTRAAR